MPHAVFVDMADTDTAVGEKILNDAGFRVSHVPSRDPRKIAIECQDADALLVGYAQIDDTLLKALPKSRIVSLLSAGFDNVDLAAAQGRGVWVANIPSVAADDVATHALALSLSALRQIRDYENLALTDWNARIDGTPPKVGGLTLGLVGVGRIGRRVAEFASPLFGAVVGYDPLLTPGPDNDVSGLRLISQEELLEVSDVVSLHVPLLPSTANMVDDAFLSAMKQGSYLVNVSRGGLVDSHALARALDSGHLRHAALDTVDQEPPPDDHPLLGHDRVTLTPHVAYYSAFTEVEYIRVQAQNVVSLWEKGAPDFAVVTPHSERSFSVD